MEAISSLIIQYASVPVIIVAVYAAIIFKQSGKELRIFSGFLFLSCIIEIASKVMWFKSMNNMPLLHFYVAVGFVCLAWFYSVILENFISHKIIWGTVAFFLLFTIINSLFIQDFYTFNSYALTLESMLIIIMSFSTFILLLNEILKEKINPLVKSIRWINTGLFIYYTSSLLVFYFTDLFIDRFPAYLNKYLWSLHTFFSIIMYSCFFIALWNRPKN